jgi:hypothetical protein
MDIFEMTAKTNEPTKELINRELLISKRYQVDANEIKCSLQWWEKHEFVFFTLGFLACQKKTLQGQKILKYNFFVNQYIHQFKEISITIKEFLKSIFLYYKLV